MTSHKGDAARLMKAKLALSGLTMDDAKKLRMEPLSAAQTAHLHPSFHALASLRLNYLDPWGKPLPDWPKAPPFYRLRYLEALVDFSTANGGKPLRYVQEPGTVPVAYYSGNQRWPELLKDADQPLIITEGELKAAKACKEGFPTVGLGGVYNWRATKLGVLWLTSLDWPVWVKRYVYVCFDSDYRTNPHVCQALRELADALHERGAFVHLVSLPQLPDLEKTGLDDFLVHASAAQLRALLAEAEPLGLTAPLWQLNDHYLYVKDPGLVLDSVNLNKINPNAFRDHAQSTLSYQERQLKANGTVSTAPVSAAAAWLKWPLRQEVQKLTYEPGQPRRVGDPPRFNIWPGWGVTPHAGDVSPFLELVEHLFKGSEPASKQWFLRWCAYPLQYPGVKMFSSVVMHGIKHGTGKSFIGYTLGKIYGKNFTEIDQTSLHNSFNEWAEGKQFVMGDDVTGGDKRAMADFLKKMITQKEIRINGKYVPTYVVPDCINYFFTANHPDAFFLEDNDRRFFVHEVTVEPLSEGFYANYELWLDTRRDGGGGAAVFHYLRHLDLGDFNPAAPACKTMAKERMITNMQSDLASWVRMLMATPEMVLRLGDIRIDKDLFTSAELLQLYDPIGKTGTTANGLGRELARAGVRQVVNGRPLRLADGHQARYYVVRNSTQWETASPIDAAQHLNAWLTRQQTGKPVKY
jgi:hypothetical protein